MFVRPHVSEKGMERQARIGDGFLANPRVVTNTTAGNLTISLDQILGGVARFTGAAGAVTYTTETAANILAAMPDMDIGDTYTFYIVNTAAQAATIAGGASVTAVAGNLVVNATGKLFVLEKTSATAMNLYGL